jgi:RNA polymerase sigma-70 factor (ECF subfamily)
MEEITKDIIKLAARGDSNAFEKIYRSASGFVYNVALRTSGSYDTAAEITQEVFLKVYEKLSGFRQDSAFNTWLYRITVNTSLNVLTRNSRYNCRVIDINAVPDIALTESPVHERAEKNAENDEIQRLLNLLPEEQKACIVLRSVEGLSYKEIAEALNVNINTVRTRLKRAREMLVKHAPKGVVNQ